MQKGLALDMNLLYIRDRIGCCRSSVW